MNIGEQIKSLRIEKNLTQKELAKMIGVSVQAVSKWECGGSPDLSLLPRIADLFEISIDQLFGRESTSHTKLEKRIFQVLTAQQGQEERMARAFQLIWAVCKSLCEVGVDPSLPLSENGDPFDLNCTRMNVALDTGFLYGLVQENQPWFFMMKESPEGVRSLLCESKDLAEFYKILSDQAFLDLVIYFHKNRSNLLSLEYICRENQLSKDQALQYIDQLLDMGWLQAEQVELSAGTTTIYRPLLATAFVAFLVLSTECLNKINFWYISNLKRKRSHL